MNPRFHDTAMRMGAVTDRSVGLMDGLPAALSGLPRMGVVPRGFVFGSTPGLYSRCFAAV